MKRIRISPDLALPLDVVTSTVVIYGGKGMGKTNLGSVLVEELDEAGLRWCALDPLGVWWGLRHSRDGKGPGIECLILGGAHGDIPIEPTGGAVVADLVVDEPANVIIDFSRKPSGEMWSKGEKIRFITDYAQRLFRRQGELVGGRRREPIFQLLDEAARYIPQLIPAGSRDLAECVGAWETLVEEGRNIGIGVGLLTQRSARMNKSVSELADAIFSFRVVGPLSIDAIMDWLGSHVPKEQIRSMVETVRSLERGDCLVVSPGWLKFEKVVHIRERTTFDSSATPRPGERAKKVTGKAAKPDLSKYADRMKETIERAKESDPRELKATIAQLRAKLAKEPAAAPAPAKAPKISRAEIKKQIEPRLQKKIARALRNRDVEWTRAVRDYLERIKRADFSPPETPKIVVDLVEEMEAEQTREIARGFDVPLHLVDKQRATLPVERPIAKPSTSSTSETAHASNGNDAGHLTPKQVDILAGLAEAEAIGRKSVVKSFLGALSGASSSSSSYEKNLGRLRTLGLVDYPRPGEISLTLSGRAIAPTKDSPATPAEMLERCKSLVTPAKAKILQALADAGGRLSKVDLGQAADASYSSSSYEKNLGSLRSAGMIDYPAPGQIELEKWVLLQ